MKIAIIGSGIAGNVLAWKLGDDHDVSVFEAGAHLGGHTHTHSLELEGREINVDSGFIVFNERTYPNFLELLSELGVEKQPAEMSFSVHCEKTGLEYAGTSLSSLFAQRRNLFNHQFYRLLGDILRFNKQSPALLAGDTESITLGEYLRDEKYSDIFQRYYILPMGAAIWSQDVDALRDFPARFFIRFFANHGLLGIRDRPRWFVVKGGSKTYVEKIYRRFSGQIMLNTPVERVRRFPEWVEVASRRGVERFDVVFFACHSDQALVILGDPTDEERQTLSAIPYQRNHAILHLGDDLLPRRRLARSSWNYRLVAGHPGQATVTYDMKKLQSLPLNGDICVTLNGGEHVDQRKVIASTDYDHPVFTREGIRAQQNQYLINGSIRTFYCGAYWRYGFHEDGVVSALTVLEHFHDWADRYEHGYLYRAG